MDPGFPAAAAGELAQRGASGAGSTGLGLDIARRAAEASGGTLTAVHFLQSRREVMLNSGGQPGRRNAVRGE